MKFPVKQLPYVTLWKNLAALENGYVTGLEPGTGLPYTRSIERKAGRVPKLAPRESRQFTVDVTIHPNRGEVADAVARIDRVQAITKPILESIGAGPSPS